MADCSISYVAELQVGHQRVAEQLKQVQATMRENSGAFQFAMVIDGKALQYGLSERLAPLFLEVGLGLRVVGEEAECRFDQTCRQGRLHSLRYMYALHAADLSGCMA